MARVGGGGTEEFQESVCKSVSFTTPSPALQIAGLEGWDRGIWKEYFLFKSVIIYLSSPALDISGSRETGWVGEFSRTFFCRSVILYTPSPALDISGSKGSWGLGTEDFLLFYRLPNLHQKFGYAPQITTVSPPKNSKTTKNLQNGVLQLEKVWERVKGTAYPCVPTGIEPCLPPITL